jgi:ubiquinone/menaquinone biosynthesis C-methylase UbiE
VQITDIYDAQKRYYDLRAPEYDRTAWENTSASPDEVASVISALSALEPLTTLDIACGTGFLTQHLAGELTILDASARMLELAARRVPHALAVHSDALPLPFSSGSFGRVFSSAFYDHLMPRDRRAFLDEARRVGRELVLVEQTRSGPHWEGRQQRTLSDGSKHFIYLTYFTAASLRRELGGGRILCQGPHLMVAQKRW